MKRLFVLLTVLAGFSGNVYAMERAENVAPVMLTPQELSWRLQQQRQARQEAVRRIREQQRQGNNYRPRNLNMQLRNVEVDAESAGDMDVEF